MQKLLENLPKIHLRPDRNFSRDIVKAIPETAGVYSYFKDGKKPPAPIKTK